MDEKQPRELMKQGLGVQEVLQVVGDALIENGCDDFMVPAQAAHFTG